MSETPTLHEEIVRKTYETIERLELDRTSGKITAAQYGCGIDTLWSAVGGLVDGDFLVAIEQMNENRRAPETKIVFWHETSGALVRLVNNHAGRLTYTMFRSGQNAINHVFDYKDEVNPLEAVRAKLREIIKTLNSKGFSLL